MPLAAIRKRVGSITAYAILAVAFQACCAGAHDGQEDLLPAVHPPLPAGDRPLNSSLSLPGVKEPAATKTPKRRGPQAPVLRSTAPPVERAAKGTGLQATALRAGHRRGRPVQPPQPGNRTKSGQPPGSTTVWKTLMLKAGKGAKVKTKGIGKQGGNGGSEQSGLPRLAPEASSGRGRRKQLTAIIAAVAIVVLLGTCAWGLRMRTMPRLPLAGNAKILAGEHDGPPPHLRVRHWLTGDSGLNQRK